MCMQDFSDKYYNEPKQSHCNVQMENHLNNAQHRMKQLNNDFKELNFDF